MTEERERSEQRKGKRGQRREEKGEQRLELEQIEGTMLQKQTLQETTTSEPIL